MSSSVELARELHEELERYERAVCAVLEGEDDGAGAKEAAPKRKSHKDALVQSHKVRRLLDSMQERARKLVRRDRTPPRRRPAPLPPPPA